MENFVLRSWHWLLFAAYLLLVTPCEAADGISFSRDIGPLLAAKCYECHGPDALQRQAGLRLDNRAGATLLLDSGSTAIVPGDSAQSELIRRVFADDDDRMPPLDLKYSLSTADKEMLRAWIDAGAEWQTHWAYDTLDRRPPPNVLNRQWPANPIDRFVLARLESAGLEPARTTDRYSLIRRVYFDLVGLPPNSDAINAFVQDDRADAYQRMVDRLLASPAYGERWGRHWLDVARYGDSNGGDENHAYPLAHRYRDYVIGAFNRDLPYDRFILQQLAGDLLESSGDEQLDRQRLTATGYLAIGMKILAEQDPVKKQADLVDEQIDTFGRTFLGLSLGCARCHDHKFDPIPTADYYALAGILHSTNVENRALPSRQFAQRLQQHNERVEKLKAELSRAQQTLDDAYEQAEMILREAESFDRGNVTVDRTNYGKQIGIISDPGGGQLNFAEFDIEVPEAARYVLQLRYAAAKSRPGKLLVNNDVVSDQAISQTTGSWFPDTQRWFSEGEAELISGKNTLRIESQPMMSHIDKIRLIRRDQVDLPALDQIEQLTRSLTKLEKQKPAATMVMAVGDGEPKNVKIHLRGSHLSLGNEVPRRFLQVLDGHSKPITAQQSGRLDLARWLTENDTATRLTSRVLVNRLWHWHFGRGLVTTPDDFGVRGSPPTHPRLLDFLAARLIDERWSIKAIHRLIVTSQTYRMSTASSNDRGRKVDPANLLYWKRDRIRLEAETLRDALLTHAGQLVEQYGNAPMIVKSQNPSPEDMQNNLHKYESSRRRSIYLSVVRSNVYEFLTLFDFPNASSPVGKRNQTTIPTQALWMMNSPFVVRQARHIAANCQTAAGEEEDAIRSLYLRLFGRHATENEVANGLTFLRQYRKLDKQSETDDIELTAWTAYCQVLVCSNEILYLN